MILHDSWDRYCWMNDDDGVWNEWVKHTQQKLTLKSGERDGKRIKKWWLWLVWDIFFMKNLPFNSLLSVSAAAFNLLNFNLLQLNYSPLKKV